MAAGILGRKIGMTRVFTDIGEQVPVTVLQVGPCVVIGKRTLEKDKYSALRIGFGERKDKHTNKAQAGEAKKTGQKAPRVIREYRMSPEEAAKYEVGQILTAEVFSKGQSLDITGVSRGKGFQGVVKMHHMAGFVEAHGSHEYYRHAGAIGQRKTPGRVFLGKRMPGHMGTDTVTIQNLKVVDVDAKNGLVLVHGAVPGHKTTLLSLSISIKSKK